MANGYAELKERLDKIEASRHRLCGQLEHIDKEIAKRTKAIKDLGFDSELEAKEFLDSNGEELVAMMNKLDDIVSEMEGSV